MEKTKAFTLLCVSVAVCVTYVNCVCDQSPCISLQSQLDGTSTDSKRHAQQYCHVAVPYTRCLKSLPDDCQNGQMADLIAYMQREMTNNECSSSTVVTVSILTYAMSVITTYLL